MDLKREIQVVDASGKGVENVFIETENAYTTNCSGKLIIETKDPNGAVKFSAFGADTLEVPFCLLSGKIRLKDGNFEQQISEATTEEETPETTTATTTVENVVQAKEMTIIEKHWGKAAFAGFGLFLISKMGKND